MPEKHKLPQNVLLFRTLQIRYKKTHNKYTIYYMDFFRDKDSFKIRSNVEKQVVVTLCQVSDNNKLKVSIRCSHIM